MANKTSEPAEGLKLSPVLKFRTAYDDREFMRRTLIYLSEEKDSPVDILSAEFSEPETEEKDFLFVSGTASADFSCMVGKDRQEEYWDKERYTKDGQTYYRDVKRTRTVTDWSPFSGHNSGKYFAVVFNGKMESGDERSRIENEANSEIQAFHRMQSEMTEEEKAKRYEEREEPFEVDEGAVESAKSTFIYRCASQTIPGDHHRDLKYSGTADVERIFRLRFPFYSVSFRYGGENCKAQAIASSRLPVRTEYPHAEEQAEQAKMLKKKRMPFLFASIGCFAAFLLFCALIQFAVWLVAFALPAIVGGWVCLFLFFLMKKKLQEKVVHERLLMKKEILIKELEKRGYAPLTPEEEKRF